MQLKHVLAVIDFHTDTDHRAAWRAAHLACSHRADLCLLTLVEAPDAHPSARYGATAPPARARADLLYLASQMREYLGLHPAVILGLDAEAAEILDACTRRADLLITAAQGHRLSMIKGAAQRHKTPLLRSRLPASQAHRAALVIDEAGATPPQSLLEAALWWCQPDDIHAVHVKKPKLWPTLSGQRTAAQDHAEREAMQGLQTALRQAGLPAARAQVLNARATAALTHRQQGSGASLLVRRLRPAANWRQLLRPDPVHAWTSQLHCDVLALPDCLASAKVARTLLRGGYTEQVANDGEA